MRPVLVYTAMALACGIVAAAAILNAAAFRRCEVYHLEFHLIGKTAVDWPVCDRWRKP